MSLFRKNALDALSTPEKLDQPLQLLSASYWSLCIGLTGFSISILLWSIFGRLPVRITGSGVLIRTESLQRVQSETTGRVAELKVNVGECVKKGSELAKIEATELELARQKAEARLVLFLDQDMREDQLSRLREQQLEEQLKRVESIIESGAISQDDLAQRQQSLMATKLDLESRNNQRHKDIEEQKNQIKQHNQTIQAKSIVRAPKKGCVIDRQVKVGEVVQVGSTLFELDDISNNDMLQSFAFFAPRDGKRLKIGQKVQITPGTTKAQRHGGIQGEIIKIKSLPVSEGAVTARLGNPSWLKSIGGKTQGPLIEVQTSLARSDSTLSGFDWGTGEGPDLQITSGTPTSIRVLVEERRPISYVIPLLRDLTGIY